MNNILCIGDSEYGNFISYALANDSKPKVISLYRDDIPDKELVRVLKTAQVVVFTGGEDVSPSLYNHRVFKTTYSSLSRDTFESRVFNLALENKIPMVGICRGSQFLYVKFGGTLIQHVEGHGKLHTILASQNKIVPRELFFEYHVNSTHHQMADIRSKPSEVELIAVARPSISPSHYYYDIENGEFRDVPNLLEVEAWWNPSLKVLGIQWHPEMDSCPSDGKYFAADLIRGMLL